MNGHSCCIPVHDSLFTLCTFLTHCHSPFLELNCTKSLVWLRWPIDEILREPSSVQAWAARQTLKLSFQPTLVKANRAPGLAICVERLLFTQGTWGNTLRLITSAFPLGSSSAGCVPRPSRPDTVLQRTCLRTTEMQINIEWTNWLHCILQNNKL